MFQPIGYRGGYIKKRTAWKSKVEIQLSTPEAFTSKMLNIKQTSPKFYTNQNIVLHNPRLHPTVLRLCLKVPFTYTFVIVYDKSYGWSNLPLSSSWAFTICFIYTKLVHSSFYPEILNHFTEKFIKYDKIAQLRNQTIFKWFLISLIEFGFWFVNWECILTKDFQMN